MSFRKRPTKREDWAKLCTRCSEALSRLERIEFVFGSDSHFEQFIQNGRVECGEGTAVLSELTAAEWSALQDFLDVYSVDWESWFVPTLYPAYFREIDRRE